MLKSAVNIYVYRVITKLSLGASDFISLLLISIELILYCYH